MKSFIKIHPTDNVAVALKDLNEGEVITKGTTVKLTLSSDYKD